MGNTYNSLKNVFQNLIKESKENRSFIPVLLVLVTVPLSYAMNNIALGLFFAVAVINFRKANFFFQSHLILPILLYALMAASYFWSIDKESTLSALSKEVSLLIIPLGFLFIKDFSKDEKKKIISYYSYFIAILVVYYLIRAVIRYFVLQDFRVFFYHGTNEDNFGLVPKLLNAIHVSVFVAVAFFYFFTKEIKSRMDIFLSVLLFGFVLLLSSKNIILVFILLVILHLFFFSKASHKLRLRNLIVFGLIIGLIFSFGRIKTRFQQEFQTNTNKSLSANVIEGVPVGVHYVSLKEAWSNETFTPNDYFPGTAFRVYQFRIFTELLCEENVFLTGFGLNASYPKIEEKAKHYNLFMGNDETEGYQAKNFHNQYIQNFAELGILGFVLLLLMFVINVKIAYKSKDFVHFAFAILMISLFLTESFLWRQRGVVYFTIMYCLFNSGITINNSKAA
ncbi:O-antigen ligase family protein [Flavobacterium sp. UBA7682]|uniref:O-antigen ligase family protein n=1 Tax=Flavobacterium sp. UBA7682 TaxID=1946560 RepID=UPI0025BCD098|nr:O-antigen ligase family protein [Flavobacterium sp. UBA7682]